MIYPFDIEFKTLALEGVSRWDTEQGEAFYSMYKDSSGWFISRSYFAKRYHERNYFQSPEEAIAYWEIME